jgi:hypothetical protein
MPYYFEAVFREIKAGMKEDVRDENLARLNILPT